MNENKFFYLCYWYDHWYDTGETNEVIKSIGVYSSEELLLEAIERMKNDAEILKLPHGGKGLEHGAPQGLYWCEIYLDGEPAWESGFINI